MMTATEFRLALAQRCNTISTHYACPKTAGGKNALVRAPLPLNPLPERFGLYLIAPGSDATRIGVLDFDNHGTPPLPWAAMVEAARPVVAHLRALGHFPMAFRSKGGWGIQIWLVWDAPQSGAAVRALQFDAAEACGFEVGAEGVAAGQVEVFPKQDAVPANGWGNPIDPPLAGRSAPLHPDDLSELANPPLLVSSRPLGAAPAPGPEDSRRDPGWDEARVQSALAAIPPDDYDDWITVLRALLGGATRAGVDARPIAEEWSRRSAKHDLREFDRKWERAFPKERAGRGRSLKTLYWHAINRFNWKPPKPKCSVERIAIQMSNPRLYYVYLHDTSTPVQMDLATLGGGQKFRLACIEAAREPAKAPSDEDLRRLLHEAEEIEVGEEATTHGQFMEHLRKFVDWTRGKERCEVRLGRSWVDERNGIVWFRVDALEDYFKVHRIYDYKRKDLFALVRALKGASRTFNSGTNNRGDRYQNCRAWFVPYVAEPDVEPDAAPLPDILGDPATAHETPAARARLHREHRTPAGTVALVPTPRSDR